MKVRKYQVNGRSFISIVDESDCPVDPYVSVYTSGLCAEFSQNSAVRYTYELLFVLESFALEGIDLISRVASGHLLTNEEYLAFSQRARHQKKACLKRNVVSFRSVRDKTLRNAIFLAARSDDLAAAETAQGRIRRLRLFVEWLFLRFHGHNEVHEQLERSLLRLTGWMKLDERKLRRNSNRGTKSIAESVIPDEKFRELLEVLRPSSIRNPFTISKLRNSLIVRILAHTGIRRGALAKLKISDCHFYGSYNRISIYRSENDPSDSRLEKPNQKTGRHDSYVDPQIMRDLRFYIDHVRALFPGASSHDYIFITEQNSQGTIGQPLSLKSINRIFEVLSNEINFHIHPHALRHKWNEIFDERGTDKGVDRRLLEDMRKHAMGWSANSEMGHIYNDKQLQKRTEELMREHQRNLEMASDE